MTCFFYCNNILTGTFCKILIITFAKRTLRLSSRNATFLWHFRLSFFILIISPLTLMVWWKLRSLKWLISSLSQCRMPPIHFFRGGGWGRGILRKQFCVLYTFWAYSILTTLTSISYQGYAFLPPPPFNNSNELPLATRTQTKSIQNNVGSKMVI